MAKPTKPTGLRAQIKAQQPVSVQVKLPGVSEPVTIRELDLEGYLQMSERFKAAGENTRDLQRVNAWMITACAFDSAGQRLYDPTNEQDVDEVIGMPSRIRKPLAKAVSDVNGFTENVVEKAEKN